MRGEGEAGGWPVKSIEGGLLHVGFIPGTGEIAQVTPEMAVWSGSRGAKMALHWPLQVNVIVGS